jgi:uncharacterized damage-inducible protein DinB
MTLLSEYAREQYELIKASRHILLEYCSTIAPQHLLHSNASFGRGGSIRNLLVHIANVYESWIGQQALKSIADIRSLFDAIDTMIEEFIKKMDSRDMQKITFEFNNEQRLSSAFQIFTHVITHEFHHKGQILSMSRQLGYTPVDTDIIR